MATFYVLPSRREFGQRFGDLLASMFPGIRHAAWDGPDLAESLAGLVEAQPEVHVVYREDLDERLSLKDELALHFGASLDDAIVEVQFGPGLTQFLHQHWSTETRRAA
jgi:hypothetical protein